MASTSVSAKDPIRLGVMVLTIGTALIHLYLGLQGFPLFILNCLGYLGLLAALTLPISGIARYRNITRWVLVGYVALTIFLWILVAERNLIGYADKVIDLALISLLLIGARRSHR